MTPMIISQPGLNQRTGDAQRGSRNPADDPLQTGADGPAASLSPCDTPPDFKQVLASMPDDAAREQRTTAMAPKSLSPGQALFTLPLEWGAPAEPSTNASAGGDDGAGPDRSQGGPVEGQPFAGLLAVLPQLLAQPVTQPACDAANQDVAQAGGQDPAETAAAQSRAPVIQPGERNVAASLNGGTSETAAAVGVSAGSPHAEIANPRAQVNAQPAQPRGTAAALEVPRSLEGSGSLTKAAAHRIADAVSIGDPAADDDDEIEQPLATALRPVSIKAERPELRQRPLQTLSPAAHNDTSPTPLAPRTAQPAATPDGDAKAAMNEQADVGTADVTVGPVTLAERHVAPPERLGAVTQIAAKISSEVARDLPRIAADSQPAPQISKTIELQLQPKDLGLVTVRLSLTRDGLAVSLRLANQSLVHDIQSQRQLLGRMIEECGTRLEDLVVEAAKGTAGSAQITPRPEPEPPGDSPAQALPSPQQRDGMIGNGQSPGQGGSSRTPRRADNDGSGKVHESEPGDAGRVTRSTPARGTIYL